MLQKEAAVNSSREWIQGKFNRFEESVIFSVVYALFKNRFKLLGFNWLIKLSWQLRCPQTEQKSQQVLIFSSRAYPLISRGLWLNSPLTCLGFACSNLAKKNKRLLTVYTLTSEKIKEVWWKLSLYPVFFFWFFPVHIW